MSAPHEDIVRAHGNQKVAYIHTRYFQHVRAEIHAVARLCGQTLQGGGG